MHRATCPIVEETLRGKDSHRSEVSYKSSSTFPTDDDRVGGGCCIPWPTPAQARARHVPTGCRVDTAHSAPLRLSCHWSIRRGGWMAGVIATATARTGATATSSSNIVRTSSNPQEQRHRAQARSYNSCGDLRQGCRSALARDASDRGVNPLPQKAKPAQGVFQPRKLRTSPVHPSTGSGRTGLVQRFPNPIRNHERQSMRRE